jgi:hypothetical protein
MKTIIEMAREAGFEVDVYPEPGLYLRLERFSALVRADEREACAKVCESGQKNSWGCAEEIRARENT